MHPDTDADTFDTEDPSPAKHRGDGAPADAAGAVDQAHPDRRPLCAILEDLEKPIKPRHLETKRKGGDELTYCPWYRVKRYLDHYTNGHWSKDVELHTTDRRIFVTVTIAIHAADQTATRSATGTELLYEVDEETGEVSEIAYGDPSSNAESMAFRRACAQFGLGLGLYEG
jgi:hypothetical protein